MDPETSRKIWRVHYQFKSRRTKHGMARDGPYWYGYFYENGKQRRVYIGKKLPKQFRALLRSRTKPSGRTRYVWPGSQQTA